MFASDPRTDDRVELLGGAVHQPGIPLRADAEQHHHQDGQHPLPHRQRLLSRLQVGTELKDLIILSFFQVNVSQRGVGNEGGPGYHYPP